MAARIAVPTAHLIGVDRSDEKPMARIVRCKCRLHPQRRITLGADTALRAAGNDVTSFETTEARAIFDSMKYAVPAGALPRIDVMNKT
jgi:hypothetical protein